MRDRANAAYDNADRAMERVRELEAKLNALCAHLGVSVEKPANSFVVNKRKP